MSQRKEELESLKLEILNTNRELEHSLDRDKTLSQLFLMLFSTSLIIILIFLMFDIFIGVITGIIFCAICAFTVYYLLVDIERIKDEIYENNLKCVEFQRELDFLNLCEQTKKKVRQRLNE